MRMLLFLALGFTACQTAEKMNGPDVARSEVQVSKAPDMAAYTNKFKELPLAASLTKLPWPSDNWATVHGGASFRWQLARADDAEDEADLAPYINYRLGDNQDTAVLSPIEKLDLYENHKDWALTKAERQRTLGQKNKDGTPRENIPEWEGIQHAWAIAALQFAPVAPVRIQQENGGKEAVRFEAQDIYSLLSLYVHDQAPRPIVLAARCASREADRQELGAGSGPYAFENAKQALRRKKCDAIDPATFHITLANQIGKLNQGFIADLDHVGEISNQPVVAYESRIVGDADAINSLAGPKTVRMKTIVFLTANTPVAEDDANEEYPYDTETYEYDLNIAADGSITGGQWLDAKNSTIPDFLWTSAPVWLSGPLKKIYDEGQQTYAKEGTTQARPIEDMPSDDRRTLNAYFSGSKGEKKSRE